MKKKIAVCGVPEFAVTFFEELRKDDRFEIEFVIYKEAKKFDRKKNLILTPVEIWGTQNKIKCIEFNELKNNAEILKSIDCVLLFSFGKIISKTMLELPKFGWLNLHPSDLPKYRGPSPIQFSIINNEKISCLTLMKMNEKMDEGDIIDKKFFEITENDTFDSIILKIQNFKAHVNNKIYEYLAGKIQPTKQIGEPTYSKMIEKEMHFEENDELKLNKMRALGFVYINYDGQLLKCFEAKIENDKFSPKIVQPMNKNKMTFKDFLNGIKKI